MVSPIPPGTRIAQARIRTSGADAAACASRCAAALPALDLEPAGMPPQAILCIRSLADPLPGGIDGRSRHAETRPLAWEAAARDAVATMLQRAARPVTGSVPPGADAVFFADEAEMLACAARDACAGSLAAHWWWRHLLPHASFDRVVTAWARVPAYIPAAFDTLVAIRAAVEWVSRLTPARSAMLLDTTLRTHALGTLADAIDRVWRSVPAETRLEPRRAAGGPFPSPLPVERARLLGAASSPWRHVVPAAWDDASIPLEGRTFAALCIVLRRAAWLTRSPSFTTAVAAHLTAEVRTSPSRHASVHEAISSIAIDRASSGPPRSVAARPERPQQNVQTPPAKVAPGDAPLLSRHVARSDSGAASIPPLAPVDAEPSRRSLSTRSRRSTADSAGSGTVNATAGPPGPVHSLVTPTECVDSAPEAASVEGVESALAGSFFLINVATDLGLYSHGIVVCEDVDISIWRFIEIASVSLLRDVDGGDDVDQRDPLWRLLRQLADPADDAADVVPDRKTTRRERRIVKRVRTHLAALLDVEDAGTVLVRRPGLITRSPAHLDVHFALDRHPFVIRQARLDRNPGWIPAAGVHVAFHFN